MAKRRRQSPLEDLAEALGFVFTWVHPLWSIPTAFVAWILVTKVLPPDISVAESLAPVWNFVGIMIALSCLAGGAFGWQARSKKLGFAKANLDLDWVMKMDWREFEEDAAESYRSQGFIVELLGGSQPDGGIDFRMERDGLTYVVQCKHWKKQSVGVKPIREFFGVMAAEEADREIFMASGSYTRDAVDFAANKPIEMIAREGFLISFVSISGASTLSWVNPSRHRNRSILL